MRGDERTRDGACRAAMVERIPTAAIHGVSGLELGSRDLRFLL